MDAIVLGRVGHYHVPNSATGYCQTAMVVDVDQVDDILDGVNVVAWTHDGDQEPHLGVAVASEPDNAVASFHLTRDCPWGR